VSFVLFQATPIINTWEAGRLEQRNGAGGAQKFILSNFILRNEPELCLKKYIKNGEKDLKDADSPIGTYTWTS
jgi:hypothetical protein